MSFVVDTDTCSAYLKGNRRVQNRFLQYTGGIYVSALTLGELYTWAYRQKMNVTARVEATGYLLSDVHLLPVDQRVAFAFGTSRAEMLSRGLVVSQVDLFIAATGLLYDYTVVTNNEKHFQLVPGLRIENWLTV